MKITKEKCVTLNLDEVKDILIRNVFTTSEIENAFNIFYMWNGKSMSLTIRTTEKR